RRARAARGSPLLPEARGDQRADGVDGGRGVLALRVDGHARALRAAEEEHAHDALRVRALPVLLELDLADVARRELHELGRRARVEAELVDDLERALGAAHVGLSTSRCATTALCPAPRSQPPSVSAIATERWRPPVQPTAIVR